jgi:outer membrane protein with beta-barrel domain
MSRSRSSRTRYFGIVTGALLSLLLTAPPASAQWFADVYLEGAYTQRSDVTIKSPTGDTTIPHERFNTSSGYGGRFGYWFESARYLGLSLDVSHFRPDTVPGALKRLDLYETPLSFDLMLRWPLLTTEEIPQGRLQPYLTVGPAVALAEAKDTSNFTPTDQYKTDFPIGVQGGVGLAWQLYSHVAIFVEYRFTHFRPEFTFRNSPGPSKVQFDLNTHFPAAGLSLRF